MQKASSSHRWRNTALKIRNYGYVTTPSSWTESAVTFCTQYPCPTGLGCFLAWLMWVIWLVAHSCQAGGIWCSFGASFLNQMNLLPLHQHFTVRKGSPFLPWLNFHLNVQTCDGNVIVSFRLLAVSCICAPYAGRHSLTGSWTSFFAVK